MTDKSNEDKIREYFEQLGIGTPDQTDIDKVQIYHMEQVEAANELYQSAVADGVNFAVMDEEGDTFVNTKWLGMVTRTLVEGMVLLGDDAHPSLMISAEVLGQTIIAAHKFVGK